MTKKIVIIFMLLLLSVDNYPRENYMNDEGGRVSNSPAFVSAVQTYVIVELATQGISDDLLAVKIMNMFGRPMEHIYKMIYDESGGDVPELFKPFYPYLPEYRVDTWHT